MAHSPAVVVAAADSGHLRGEGRLLFVDAARGCAMAFVLLSHFNRVYFSSAPHEGVRDLLTRISMVASPTFMIISGLLLGYLFTANPTRVAALRTKLTDRGLFLLTVGHVLILGAHLIQTASITWMFMTDAVGGSMIAGAFLVDKLSARRRLALSASLYAASWLAVAMWMPHSLTGHFVKDALVGPRGDSLVYGYCFPLLPWFAVYLASTALGERVATLHRRGDAAGMARLLAQCAVAAFVLVGVIRTASVVVSLLGGFGSLSEFAAMVTWGEQKVPPGPVYVLFHGGLGLLMLSALCLVEHRGLATGFLRRAAIVGQNALFVFILQYYVYNALLARLHLAVTSLWPVWFGLTVAIIGLATMVCHRHRWTSLITVGYGRRRQRRMDTRDLRPAIAPGQPFLPVASR